MNIDTYIEQARSTAIYPGHFTYPAIGLAGESGELIDKITSLTSHKLVDKKEVIKECGDLIWYVVSTAIDVGIKPFAGKTFTQYGQLIGAGVDKRSALIKLPVYVGKISEIAKKQIRDNDYLDLGDDKVYIIEDCLTQIMRCLFEIADEWDINMDDVAQVNIDKLLSRKERGVLKGEGDNR